MPVQNLTAQWVANVTAPSTSRVDYFDQRVLGLGLRVSPGGGKTWFVMYRVKGDPRKRRLTIDGYPALTLADARERAQEARLAASRGQDPAKEKQTLKSAATFGALAAEYLEKHAKRKKRSWKEDERVVKRELTHGWGRRKVHDIGRIDVLELLDRIVDRGAPIQANRTLALVRKIFNWGIGRGIVDHNPCLQVEAPSSEHQRQRVLSEDEIRALWHAFDGLGPLMGPMFKLRLLTAQRGGEVQSMRWQDIDLNGGSWTIPPLRAKNGLAHFVPLSDAAVRRAPSINSADSATTSLILLAVSVCAETNSGSRADRFFRLLQSGVPLHAFQMCLLARCAVAFTRRTPSPPNHHEITDVLATFLSRPPRPPRWFTVFPSEAYRRFGS